MKYLPGNSHNITLLFPYQIKDNTEKQTRNIFVTDRKNMHAYNLLIYLAYIFIDNQ